MADEPEADQEVRPMSADANTKTIQAVYEAFGRGDVAAIVDVVTDDVDWGAETSSTAVPWYGVHHGKDGVVSFFEAFGSTMDVEQFEPVSFAANDTDVHTLVHFKAKRRATGASLAMDLHHFFQFRDGKISYYRGTEDSALTAAAFQD
jgi:ketosteroid isomerase-like protein